MNPVMHFGGASGLVVSRREPVWNKRTSQWDVTEPGTYTDFYDLAKHTTSYENLQDAVQVIMESQQVKEDNEQR